MRAAWHVAAWVTVMAAGVVCSRCGAAEPSRPNILFIAIDDQNDWVGHMGGHPAVKTPHLDALAARGTTFLNAHCNAPLCNPSRASLLTGLRPSTIGIYGLAPNFRSLPEWRDRITLPQHFGSADYSTAATGKIFHQGPQSTAPPQKRKPNRNLPEPRLRRLQDAGQWRHLVRSYLACTSFVDSQVGRLLSALEESGHRDDTIVVVWGDHGWHLGEKEITGKNSLWDRGTKVPLIFAGPGITAGGRCTQPAELLDVYPTLCELAALPPPAGLEGLSLVPQLRDAAAKRERPAITTHNQGNHGVRSERWRYIRYADGSEELYDMQDDPREWTNLAASPTHTDVVAEHRRWLPATNAAPAAGSAIRFLTYDPATDEATWEGRPVRRSDPIPE